MTKFILSLIIVIIALTSISFAEDTKQLDAYLNKNYFDFLGREGEQLYFQQRHNYSNGNPFKDLFYDINNIPLQATLTEKAYNDNWFIYTPLLSIKLIHPFFKTLPDKTKLNLIKRIIKP